jgi:hypothetical protein
VNTAIVVIRYFLVNRRTDRERGRIEWFIPSSALSETLPYCR